VLFNTTPLKMAISLSVLDSPYGIDAAFDEVVDEDEDEFCGFCEEDDEYYDDVYYDDEYYDEYVAKHYNLSAFKDVVPIFDPNCSLSSTEISLSIPSKVRSGKAVAGGFLD
jgi:hypothetical protein